MSKRKEGVEVCVLVYTHNNGEDVGVYWTKDDAIDGAVSIVREWYEQELGEDDAETVRQLLADGCWWEACETYCLCADEQITFYESIVLPLVTPKMVKRARSGLKKALKALT